MNPALTVYNHEVNQYIQKDFEVVTLAADCLFTEGPVWNPDGFYLFSDTTANVVYKIAEHNHKQVFLKNSGTNDLENSYLKPGQGGSNGLAYNADGELLICQHGNHAIAKYDGQAIQSFIGTYNGKPFNSPNDLILHSDGRIFFSDPPYGLKDAQPNPQAFQPVAGVYCWQQGKLQLFCNRYQYPNGVCLSKDEKQLLICSAKPFENFISVYNTTTLAFERVFAEETSDGIEFDAFGNVYLCNREGIVILGKNGKRLALIALPTIPANLCWGGKHLTDLFITARQNIFLIKNLQKA